MLRNPGFTKEQINQSALLIIGRLLHPASERETARWARDVSALDELMGADFRHLSNNALCRASDLLIQHRWWTIRNLMSSQTRVTTSLTVKGDGAGDKRDENKISVMCDGGRMDKDIGNAGQSRICRSGGTNEGYKMGDVGKTSGEYRTDWENGIAREGGDDRVGAMDGEGKRFHIRQTLDPEPHHLKIYRALKLPPVPLKPKRTFL